MKKLVSYILSLVLTFSTVFVPNSQAIVLNNNISLANNISSSIGRVTDSFLPNENIPQIVFIQDLHSSTSVQKNISEIINNVYKNYDVNKILIEGGENKKLDTEILDIVSQYNITDELLQDGILSGSEYYYMKYNNKANIWGLENFELYKQNLKRAKYILKNNEYYISIYKQLEKQLSKKINDYKKLYKLTQFNLNDTSNFNYMNQPILKYETLYKYWNLVNNNLKLNFNKIKKQEKTFFNKIKNDFDYKKYSRYIELTKQKNKIDLYKFIYSQFEQNIQYQKRYKELYNFLKFTVANNDINLINLVDEQNSYLIDYYNSTFVNQQTKNDMFVIKMTNLLKSFLDLSITEKDYLYFVYNYEQYINLLTEYLDNTDFYKYENILLNVQTVFAYHNYNIKRTDIFVKNILKTLNNQENKAQINIVVSGGFHSSILNLLKENNISYIVFTPKVKDNNNINMYKQSITDFDNDLFYNQAMQGPRLLTLPDKLYLKHIIKKVSKGDLRIDNVVQKLNEEIGKNYKGKIKFTYDKEKGRLVIDRKVGKTKGNYKLVFGVSKEGKVLLDDNKTFQSLRKTTVKDKRNIKLSKKNKYYSNNIFKKIKNFFERKKQIQRTTDINVSYPYNAEIKQTVIKVEDDFINELIKIFGKEVDVEKILQEICDRSVRYLNFDKDDNTEKYYIDGNISIGIVESSKFLFDYDQKNKKILINRVLFEQKVIENKVLKTIDGYKYIDDNELQKIFIKLAIYNGIIYAMTNDNFIENKKELRNYLSKLPHRFLMEEFRYILDNICGFKTGLDKEEIKQIKEAIVTDLFNSKLFDDKDIFLLKFSNYFIDEEEIIDILRRKKLSGSISGEEEIKDIFYSLTVEKQQELFGKIPYEKNNENLLQILKELKTTITKNLQNKKDKKRELQQNKQDYENEKQKKEKALEKETDLEQKKLIKDGIAITEGQIKRSAEQIIETEKTEIDIKNIQIDDNIKSNIERLLDEYRKLFDSIREIVKDKNIDVDKFYTDLEYGILSGLVCMYNKMPNWMFVEYINDEFGGLQHSLNILYYTCKILENSWNIKENQQIDFKLYAYAALMHDASCLLIRDNNAENSAAFARSMFHGIVEEQELDKIEQICLGQKIIIDGSLREEHKHTLEACLLHDAEAICSDCKEGLERIYSMWENLYNGVMINEDLTIDERYRLIVQGIYTSQDGGDGLNDLIRHYTRSQDQHYYITQGAKNFLWKDYSNDDFVKFIKSKFGSGKKIKNILESNKLGINKTLKDPESIIFSDIHGGYKRILLLLYNSLFTDIKNFDDIKTLSDEELKKYEDKIILKLKEKNVPVYILGDILDRGDNIVESFDFVERLSIELGEKFHFVVGNHDLYCFMNLIGVHLPFYNGYKGIKLGYKDFNGIDINELLQKIKANNEKDSSMQYWEQKLSEYMKYADEQQKEITKVIEPKLRELFDKTFGQNLSSKDKGDVLDKPNGIFEDDEFMLEFMKKIYGRNIAGKAYIGLKGAYKMSINWWIERQNELKILKNKYPQYNDYWNELENFIGIYDKETKEWNGIIGDQIKKYQLELQKDNFDWAVIDAIMYGNYETTEWNALDWAYHAGWAAGDKGLIAQKNAQIKKQIRNILNDKKLSKKKKKEKIMEFVVRDVEKFKKIEIKSIDTEVDEDYLREILTFTEINSSNYLENTFFDRIRQFYKQHFNIYEIDNDKGNCYMHCILPIDEEGDVAIGYVDENGIFIDKENGKSIKGIKYGSTQYIGSDILKAFDKISDNIRTFSKDEIFSVIKGLKLITSIYADNTTRIKPQYINNYEKYFGLNSILENLGISRLFVGHNPVEKFGDDLNPLTNSNPIETRLINIDNGLASGANEHGMIVTVYDNGIMFNVSDSKYVGGFYREFGNTSKYNSDTESSKIREDVVYTKDDVVMVEFIDEKKEQQQYQTLENLLCRNIQSVGVKIVQVDDNEVTDKNKIIQGIEKEKINLPNDKSIHIITIKIPKNIDVTTDLVFYQELIQVLNNNGYDCSSKKVLSSNKNIFGNLFNESKINKDNTEKELITSLIYTYGDGYNGIVPLYDISQICIVDAISNIIDNSDYILDLLSAS